MFYERLKCCMFAYRLPNILKTNQSSVPKCWCGTKSAGMSRFVACLLNFPEHLGNKGHCFGWAPFPLSTLSQTSPLFRQRASRKTGGSCSPANIHTISLSNRQHPSILAFELYTETQTGKPTALYFWLLSTLGFHSFPFRALRSWSTD